ncbi:MAG: helix-turn-helix domain-containing protein [Mixta calida]|uniref:helix-turn-helix domain-containing protein n=1 Tax=Mixta calida TaxID=665913 RepID=UPI0029146F4C|nr:helix-turn-helix domain-containing protein [Mixta calida]MDU4942947.1 helix-turn-helix domain-containing protein [Mixta calida]
MINRALKAIRLYHNVKQSELADSLFISKSYLSEIEAGKKSVSFDMLEKYSKEFDIPVSAMVFFSEQLEDEKKNGLAERFRLGCADKILKVLEWSIARNEREKAKAADKR